jgi:hypothetical protein
MYATASAMAPAARVPGSQVVGPAVQAGLVVIW